MAIGAALVGMLGALGGSMIGAGAQKSANATNMELARYQNNWQQAENERAFDRSVEMWNLQNAYNTPSAQMSRLRQAGLNPNLVYGSGVTGNSAGSTPSYQPAKGERATVAPYTGWNLGLNDAVSLYMAAKRNKAEVENMEAQNALIREQVNTEGIKQSNIAASTARSKFDLGLAERLRDTSIDKAIADKNRAEAESNAAWTGANIKVMQYELDRALFENKIKLSNVQYSQAMEALRGLKQDNDINKFRNRLERVVGKSSLASDLLRRFIYSLAPVDALDNMFNPK